MLPSWCCLVVEHWPMNQKSPIWIMVRADAWVVGSVPYRGCAWGNWFKVLSHQYFYLFLLPSSLSKQSIKTSENVQRLDSFNNMKFNRDKYKVLPYVSQIKHTSINSSRSRCEHNWGFNLRVSLVFIDSSYIIKG